MRYEYAQALSQDILGEVEALWADRQVAYPPGFAPCTNQRTELDPSEDYIAAREPPPVAMFLTPVQLDALECEHRLTHPYSHNERVQYLDAVGEVLVGLPRVRDSTPRAWELVRIPFVRWGLGVLERVAVSVIAQARDVETGDPIGPERIVGTVGPGAGFVTAPDPCPFPLAHPQAGQGGVALSLVFHLLNYQHSRRISDEPPMLTAGLVTQIPLTDNFVSPWNDMRYQWGSRYTDHHQWLRGGHSLVRFFMAVESGLGFWTLRVCGRLAGYNQFAGRDGAALGSALTRH